LGNSPANLIFINEKRIQLSRILYKEG